MSDDLVGWPLGGLALAKASLDEGAGSHSESFIPAVVVVLARLGGYRSALEVSDALAVELGTRLPINVIESLLRRATRRQLVDRSDNSFKITAQGAERAEVVRARGLAARRGQQALFSALAEYFANAGVDIEVSDAERLLLAYIQAHAAPMLKLVLRSDDSEIVPSEDALRDHEHLLARFVLQAYESDPLLGPALEDLVKGAVLASAFYVEHTGEEAKKFERTSLYLDAPFILKVCGYEGPTASRAGRELLLQAEALGAKLRCFEHTVDEARGVVLAVGDVLGSGKRPSTIRGVLSSYLKLGASPSDVITDAEELERRLGDLRIGIEDTPPHDDYLSVDELEFERRLGEAIHYTRRSALHNDIDSATAVYRLRRARTASQVERCVALLVTDNRDFVNVSNRFLYQGDRSAVGVAILDHALATLLWVKSPTTAPSLPMSQVVADSLALLDPGSQVWNRLMNVVDELARSGTVDTQDVFHLRFSAEARATFMSLGATERVNPNAGVVQNVLKESRRADRLEAQNKTQGIELASSAAKLEQIERAIEAQSNLFAKRVVVAIGFVAAIASAATQVIPLLAGAWSLPVLFALIPFVLVEAALLVAHFQQSTWLFVPVRERHRKLLRARLGV